MTPCVRFFTEIHAPRVLSLTSPSSHTDVMEGDMVMLNCTVSGHPAVSVQWYAQQFTL